MTVLAGVFPGPMEVTAAARDTRELLRLRWRAVRTAQARAGIILGLFAVVTALYLVANIGYAIRRFAESGVDTVAGQFAVNFVISLQRGDLGTVGAAALGSAFAASLFSPFTGASNLALANADELTALRPRRLHRYFDAIITQAFSTIGILQLLSLTAVASLLTLDERRLPGLVIAWGIWPVLVLAAVAEGWILEYFHRRVGKAFRRITGVAVGAAVGAAVLTDPVHGKTLFGSGIEFSKAVRSAGAANGNSVAFAAVGILVTSGFVLFAIGLAIARAALALPAVPTSSARKTRHRTVPVRPKLALAQVMVLLLFRTSEVRRPILTVLALGAPVVFFTHAGPQSATTLVIACPLAIALSWGVNVFGVIGQAMPWLMSQPHAMRLLPSIAVGLQIAMTVALAGLCYLPASVVGGQTGQQTLNLAAGLAVSTALTTRGSLTKAIRRPHLTRLGSRGDSIVPPLTAVGYTMRFALLAGQLGVLTLNSGTHPERQAALVGWLCVWSILRGTRLLRQWRDPALQSSVVAAVASA